MANNKNNNWFILAIVFIIIDLIFLGFIVNEMFFNNKIANNNNNNNNNTQIQEIPSSYLVIGNANAKVTIIEYSDFQCPFCKKLYAGAYQQIKTEYVDTGKVKIVFKHFPLTNIHPNALPSAIAVECAKEQKKGEEMHNKLFENQDLSNANLKSFAAELKLDTDKFNACLDSEKYKDKVMAEQQEGIIAGVSGTPTLFINTQKLVGAQPFSVFKTAIDAELAKN